MAVSLLAMISKDLMNTPKIPKIVIVIGSAKDAIRYQSISKQAHTLVTINNAWRIREDWDYLVYPEDFPVENVPKEIAANQQLIVAEDFVPTQNAYGGFVYAGGTMAFTTAYWVLGKLKPDVMAFIGCDMVYPADGKQTHFYGFGAPDPLRDDVTLQSLEAKSQRLLVLAAQQNCLCVNLSDQLTSRLTFPRVSIAQLEGITNLDVEEKLHAVQVQFDASLIKGALDAETILGHYIESGRYWEHVASLSRTELAKIDALWMASQVN